jgi:hypothetical protein
MKVKMKQDEIVKVLISCLEEWDRVDTDSGIAIIPPAWENQYHVDDGCAEVVIIANSAQKAANQYVAGDYGDEPCSVAVRVWREAILLEDGDIVSYDEQYLSADNAACEEDEPPCPEGEHEWDNPPWLGGCDTNPGVWIGPGTSGCATSVCMLCGMYRDTIWSGSQPDPGEPSRTVRYRPADEHSLRHI